MADTDMGNSSLSAATAEANSVVSRSTRSGAQSSQVALITGSKAPEFNRQKISPMTRLPTSSCLMLATCAQIFATSSAGGDAPTRRGNFHWSTVAASPGGPTTSTS